MVGSARPGTHSTKGTGVSATIKADPDLGDVYRASPATTPQGDAHGDNARPVGVVELTPRVAKTLTRTTNPRRDVRVIESPANPRLGLVAGAWTDHKPRPVMLHWFATPNCAYLGALDEAEHEALLRFWETTKMLGRE